MRVLRTLFLTLLLGALCAPPALAQLPSDTGDSRILSPAALNAAVAGHESEADAQRAQLAELLSRSEVQHLARDHGIDMGRIQSATAGLNDREVATVTPVVAKASAALQRGGTITISAVTVIIILLLLILVT